MANKQLQYDAVLSRITALIQNEDDWVAAMATVACELHHQFDYFHWTGFYRHVGNSVLKIGPYQGTHGCLTIPFSKGVCGAAASTQTTQLVENVNQFPGHIACSSSTISEIVVPILAGDGNTVAVLDVDSDLEAAFDEVDQKNLEVLCGMLTKRYWS